MCLPLTFFLPNENSFVALPRGDVDLLLDLLFANENNVGETWPPGVNI